MTPGRDRSSPFWVVRRWYTARAAHMIGKGDVRRLEVEMWPRTGPGPLAFYAAVREVRRWQCPRSSGQGADARTEQVIELRPA